MKIALTGLLVCLAAAATFAGTTEVVDVPQYLLIRAEVVQETTDSVLLRIPAGLLDIGATGEDASDEIDDATRPPASTSHFGIRLGESVENIRKRCEQSRFCQLP